MTLFLVKKVAITQKKKKKVKRTTFIEVVDVHKHKMLLTQINRKYISRLAKLPKNTKKAKVYPCKVTANI